MARRDTVNDILADRAIRHAHFIERFKAHQVQEVVAALNGGALGPAVERVAGRLERIATQGHEVRITQTLRELNERNRRLIRQGFDTVENAHRRTMRELAKTEAEWQVKTLREATPVNLGFTLPATQTLRSIVVKRPVLGQTIREWFREASEETADRIERAVIRGIAEGQTNQQIVRTIRGTRRQGFTDGLLQTTRHKAEMVVRTSVQHVSAHAREATFEANKEIVKEVRWVSTLDGRTSLICQDLDGQTFEIGSGIRPPAHPNCRSTTVPVTKSWRELGIDLDDAPPGTRASMDGQVSERLTYPEWLRGQDESVQIQALGPARFELWKAGKVDIDSFVKDNQILTLEQLRKAEGLT